MINDISVYENTKRNDTCPCGSGKIFKKCCMHKYREAKKSLSTAKVSSFTPMKPLEKFEKDEFTEFYQKLLFFSSQYQNGSDIIHVEDENESMSSFLFKQRPYFFENSDTVIDKYVEEKNPTEKELSILEALRGVKIDTFYLLSSSAESAVLMDMDEKFYNIQALHSPFSEIFDFPSKYLALKTVLIPYKDRYITDGIYGGSATVPKEAEEYLDRVPFKDPVIHYSPNSDIRTIPLVLNFSLICNINHFKKMENIVLEKIPQTFMQGLIAVFDETYSYKKNLISSFLRSTDLAHELNNEEGDQTFSYMIGATPVTSFEQGNTTDVIPYSILKKHYVQKSIEKSYGSESYNKAKGKDFLQRLMSDYSSFYTVLGVAHIEEDRIDDLVDYLKIFDTKKKRTELTIGLENLCDELSKEYGFEITPVFLGVGTDLDSIHEEIGLYRDYMLSEKITDLNGIKEYSINKGR